MEATNSAEKKIKTYQNHHTPLEVISAISESETKRALL